MYKEFFLVLKPYLYQIYQYIVGYPECVLASLGIWFALCGVMETLREKVKKKKLLFILWKFVVFLVFLGAIIMFLYVTLGNRYQTTYMRYKLELFWSYKEIIYNKNRLAFLENMWNIIAVLPIGNALYYLLNTKKKLLKITLICGMFSICIELTQLIGRIGFFEFDDIFHNTLGAFLGALVGELLYKIRKLLFHKE